MLCAKADDCVIYMLVLEVGNDIHLYGCAYLVASCLMAGI